MAVEYRRMTQRHGSKEQLDTYKSTLLPYELVIVDDETKGNIQTSNSAVMYFKGSSSAEPKLLANEFVHKLNATSYTSSDTLYNICNGFNEIFGIYFFENINQEQVYFRGVDGLPEYVIEATFVVIKKFNYMELVAYTGELYFSRQDLSTTSSYSSWVKVR